MSAEQNGKIIECTPEHLARVEVRRLSDKSLHLKAAVYDQIRLDLQFDYDHCMKIVHDPNALPGLRHDSALEAAWVQKRLRYYFQVNPHCTCKSCTQSRMEVDTCTRTSEEKENV